MTIEATDASSTVATSSCSATIVASTLPTITSFTATPSAIATGQSSVLAWMVTNASSTSVNNGVGAVSSTSITVSPAVTTTYQLSAVNPNGTTTANVTVTVGTSTSGTGGGNVQDRIAELFRQIAVLQARLAQLIADRFGVTVDNPGFIPPGQIGKAACIILGRDLERGSHGDDVRKLQVLLAADSSLGFDVEPTGVFAEKTEKALKKFQEKHGIVSRGTGKVGPLTRGFFSRSCGVGLLRAEMNVSTTTDDDDDDDDDSDTATTTSSTGDGDNGNGNGNSGSSNNGNGNSGNGNGNGNGNDSDDDEEDEDEED